MVWVAARNSGTLWVIHPETGEIEGEVAPLRGDTPEGLAAGDGAIWVTDFSGWVNRVDSGSKTITATGRGFNYAGEIAAASSAVWISNGDFAWVSRHDPVTGAVVDSVEVGWSVLDLIIAGESVWVASDGIRGGQLSRIPLTGTSLAETIELEWRPEAMAVGEGFLWVHDSGFGAVHRLGLADGASLGRIPLGAEMHEGRGIAAGEGAIWVALGMEEAIARIDPASELVTRVSLGGFVQDVATGAGAVWAVLPEDDLLLKIDPRSLEILARIPLDGYPVAVVVG